MNALKGLTTLLPILLLAPLAQSVERVVWDTTGVSKTPPNIIYAYKGGTGSVVLDTAGMNDKPYYMSASFNVTGTKDGDYAGFGFYWNAAYNDDDELVPTTLDTKNYGGVCLTYSSSNIVRMDFKQEIISSDDGGDDNFFGYDLPSTGGVMLNKFISKDSLTPGWPSKQKWSFVENNQMGLQFSYKGKYVPKNGTKSDIYIKALRLANDCPKHAPTVNSALNTKYDLNEGKRLVIHLNDVFSDLDGDDLIFNIKWDGSGVNLKVNENTAVYSDNDPLTLADSIVFTTVKNPASTDSVVFTFTAIDPTDSVATWVIGIKPIDAKHKPFIRDSSFSVYQGGTIQFPSRFSFYGDDIEDQSYLIYDVDGDEIELFLDSTRLPAFGEFNFDLVKGSFTYKAPADTIGDVSFFLYAVEKYDKKSVSDTVEFVIHVLDVNDPPVVDVKDSMFEYFVSLDEGAETYWTMIGDSTLVIEKNEDFEDTVWIMLDESKVLFSDEDSEITLGVKTKGVVKAEIVSVSHVKYIQITSVLNANGTDVITYYADDGEFQVGVDFFVNIKAVEDLPVAVADSYDAVQGTKLSVNVKNGVLKNDVDIDNPDADLTAEVVDKPKHGTLSLREDGSFTYKSEEDFSGEDYFTYVCINELDAKSEPVKVTLNVAAKNMAPVVVEGVADSLEGVLATLVEDKLTSGKVFKISDVKNWFEDPEGGELTFDAKNEDGKLTVSVTKDAIKVSPAADAFGSSELIIIATDSAGLSCEMTLAVKIQAVNDKPVATKPEDARYDVDTSDWELEIDLDSLVTDVDGDTLKYAVAKSSNRLVEYLKIEIDGHILKVSPQKRGLEPGTDYLLTIEVSDAEYTINQVVTFHTSGTASLRAIAGAPKATWQNAILANRGVASIMDLQGRVMWNAKLPVSEADVRNASAKVQGRKVLRVNSQTWTIK